MLKGTAEPCGTANTVASRSTCGLYICGFYSESRAVSAKSIFVSFLKNAQKEKKYAVQLKEQSSAP
jgi:hypothetical protein